MTSVQDTQEALSVGFICDSWNPSFLLLLILNWHTFWRQVTARWWRQWAKNQVLTNQNWRNRWCQIVRQTICKWHPRSSEVSTQLEIAVRTHVHARHGTKTTPVFFPADWEACSWLLPSLGSLLSGGTEQLFMYPLGDRSGLTKAKKDKHQH